jgi:hypothetical protein
MGARSRFPIGLVVGLAIGLAGGIATGNTAVWIGVGAALAVVLGTACQNAAKR